MVSISTVRQYGWNSRWSHNGEVSKLRFLPVRQYPVHFLSDENDTFSAIIWLTCRSKYIQSMKSGYAIKNSYIYGLQHVYKSNKNKLQI